MLLAANSELFSAAMWDEPWTFPAIQLWVSLLQRFEGFSDASNLAVIKAILDLLKPEKRYEVQESFEKTLAPIAGHFTTVEAFQSFLLANLRAHAVMQSAQSRDSDTLAWSKAYDFIIQTLQGGCLLDNTIVDEAVTLAVSHMQQGDSDVAALQTSAPEDLSLVECYYKQRFVELEAKLNKFEHSNCSGGSKRNGGDSGDRGKRDSAGAHSGSQDSGKRDGKPKTPPKCDNLKCLSGGKHFGKCFAECDFEKEHEKLATDEKKFSELKKRRDEKHIQMATSLSDPFRDDDSDSADSFSSKADS